MNAPPKIGRPADPSDMVPASFPSGKRWYVVRTNIKCEDRAAKGLRAIGYDVFAPVLWKWVKHARLRTRSPSPLFSRYIFVGLDPNRQGWHRVRCTDGVETILSNEGVPQAVPARVIDNLRRAEEEGRFDKTRESMFEKGDRVDVEGGPFDGFVAEVEAADDGHNVDILINLLGRLTRTQIDLARIHRRD